jgi:hypothetical protein
MTAKLGISDQQSNELYSFATDKQAFSIWYTALNLLLTYNANTTTEKLGLTIKQVRHFYINALSPAETFSELQKTVPI